ncbi:hypothetical protein [Gracilimonas sp.]|uniref:hypothetical protein n=1 Tax=Gracilimonas sp. TaxID=1974203 RepID=UPI0028718573|nr:hypothetical protein [Gracilimonas sp.]
MQRFTYFLITFFILTQLISCSSIPNKDWVALIPEQSTFVVVPESGLNVQDIVAKEYASYLDDLTPTGLQQISGLNEEISSLFQVKALALTPATSVYSNILWVAESTDSRINSWAPQFYQPFTQNNYEFNGFRIHKLFFNRGEVFAAQIKDYLVLSESSLLVENSIRSYIGQDPSIELQQNPPTGSLTLNTPKLDRWLEQFALVENRPSILNKFTGTSPVTLNLSASADSVNNYELSGQIPLKGNRSLLIDALSFENRPIILDRHISDNAAAFALFRLPPPSVPLEPNDNLITPLDSLLLNDLDTYQRLSQTLNAEFAFVAFSQSGVLESGEYLWMRKTNNKEALVRELEVLADSGFVNKPDDTYQLNSRILANLIISELNTLRDIYISFSDNIVVIANRKGLAESVNADRIRRRVIYYDETYSSVYNSLPSEISGFAWADNDEFLRFITPELKQQSLASGILNRFDITSITMTTQGDALDLTFNSYMDEGSALPYEELWVLPLSDFELSGRPVFGDIVGSSLEEIIFATQSGEVYSLAVDGTIAMQTSTNGLTPVGGPVLYDWYGNNQQIVFLAAGSQIFAWNEAGDLLPRFPMELGEQISAPILVQDVLRNGVPEIVVATEDRKVHVLDGRGENVRGWPKNTNAVVTSTPAFDSLNGTWSLWAYSQNTLHSWLRSGDTRPGYPQFVNANFSGSPLIVENQIIGSAADGYIYSIGENPSFADSLATVVSEDSISVRSLYVSNSELTSVHLQENVLLQDSTGFYREDLFVTQGLNGAVFLLNKKGVLRFVKNLGQPSSTSFSPQIVDINSDQNQELLALAEFGRLFGWDILTDERLFDLPTSGMKYPVIKDLDGDGLVELIAQTREGLRCWTINRKQDSQQ